MDHRSLGHRAPLLWVLVPLMAGLVAGSHHLLPLGSPWHAAGAVVAAVTALTFRRAWSAAILSAVFLSGVALYDATRARLPDWETLPPREARVTLEIDRVFPPKPDFRSLNGLARITAGEPHLSDIAGQRVYFSFAQRADERPPPELIRGARVAATGMLQTLPEWPDHATFEGYLASQGVNFTLTRSRITGTVTPAGDYRRFCDGALRRLSALLGEGIGKHTAQVAVLRAMLLGSQHELANDQKSLFRESGTMHLFSISGLHIAVIAGVIHGLLTLTRLPRWARFLTGGMALWLYVDVTGGTPSAVRAFLMVMCFQGAQVLRRPGNAISALVTSAVCVLLVQPLQLFTASFQLSYGIVAALLLLGLPLADRWKERWALFTYLPGVSWTRAHTFANWAWQRTLEAVAIGLSTTLLGTLCGVLIFGLFTPVSLLANLVLIPLGSLVIISGFVTLLLGLLGLHPVAVLLNHASALLLIVLEHAVRLFAGLPAAFSAAEFRGPGIGFGAILVLLILLAHGYATGWDRKHGGFWSPFAFTALALIAGMRLVARA